MAMIPTDPELLNKPLAQTFAAIGGMDLLTPKTGVNPGTLQDCINFEISRESGYKIAGGLLRYSGKAYNTVNEWVEADVVLPDKAFVGELAFVVKDQTASNDGINIFAANDSEVRLLETIRIPNIPNGSFVPMAKMSPDNKYLAIAHEGESENAPTLTIYKYVNPSLEFVTATKLNSLVSAFDWNSDSDKILAFTRIGDSNSWDTVSEAATLFSFDGSSLGVLSRLSINTSISTGVVFREVQFSPTNSNLALVGGTLANGMNLRLIRVESNDSLTLLDEKDIQFGAIISECLQWTASGNEVLTHHEGGHILLTSVGATSIGSVLDSVGKGETANGSNASSDRSYLVFGRFAVTTDGSTITSSDPYVGSSYASAILNSDGNIFNLTSFSLSYYSVDLSVPSGTLLSTESNSFSRSIAVPDESSGEQFNDELHEGGEYTVTDTSGNNSTKIKVLEIDTANNKLRYQIIGKY